MMKRMAVNTSFITFLDLGIACALRVDKQSTINNRLRVRWGKKTTS
jgi:hypothetical protein